MFNSAAGTKLLGTLAEDQAEDDEISMLFDKSSRDNPTRTNYHDISLTTG
jgi:hypothetical protein